MQRSSRSLVALLAVLVVTGCSSSEMDHTEIGAVSGGVVGAGLGAIIGSATGNTAGGLAIGAAAGTAAGAGTGYVSQQTEDHIQQQDEVIQAREQQITANRTQLDALRAMSSERVAFADGSKAPSFAGRTYGGERYPAQGQFSGSGSPIGNSAPSVRNPLVEKSLMERTVVEDPNYIATEPVAIEEAPVEITSIVEPEMNAGSVEIDEPIEVAKAVTAPVETAADAVPLTPECQQALEEANDGEASDDISDKLFHVRRALRLCPQEPNYHNRLGELYVSLDRTSDAEFEFQQALTLNPEHSGAKSNLESLRKY